MTLILELFLGKVKVNNHVKGHTVRSKVIEWTKTHYVDRLLYLSH